MIDGNTHLSNPSLAWKPQVLKSQLVALVYHTGSAEESLYYSTILVINVCWFECNAENGFLEILFCPQSITPFVIQQGDVV
jgi:hypothetical protein